MTHMESLERSARLKELHTFASPGAAHFTLVDEDRQV